VHDDHRRPGQTTEQHDDVPQHSIGQQERTADPHDEDEHRNGECDRSVGLQENVVRQVKHDEEKREQRGDGEHDAWFHRALRGVIGSPDRDHVLHCAASRRAWRRTSHVIGKNILDKSEGDARGQILEDVSQTLTPP